MARPMEVSQVTTAETTTQQHTHAAQALEAADEAGYTQAILNILSDAGEEQKRQGDNQRAMLNILEDLETEKTRLESTQKALINMLDDLAVERNKVDMTNIELREVNEACLLYTSDAADDLTRVD